MATPADESWLRRIERAIKATLTKYTADGQIKVKGAKDIAPKRAKKYKPTGPTSSYQATKSKAHKATGHGGTNSRRRRKSTSQTKRNRRK